MRQHKKAFFMMEVIISIIIITGVVITIFKVKGNTIKLTSKINNRDLQNSLMILFIPHTKDDENNSFSLLEHYSLKDNELKEELIGIKSQNIILNDERKTLKGININKLNIKTKKIIISNNKYKKILYSFSER